MLSDCKEVFKRFLHFFSLNLSKEIIYDIKRKGYTQ